MDVIALPGIQKTLDRLADLLAKVQKALGEYLESQRSAFARFYFIGDEDLLEIIGNSRDLPNVQRHFTKMFAGITNLNSDDGDSLIGMASRENEHVGFSAPVVISEDPAIHAWLSKVEAQMQISLATSLEQCILKMAGSALMDSADEFPAQIMLLASQVDWSY